MILRRSGVACSLLLLSSITAMAQREEPSVDDILNHYIRALGGKAAIRKLTSRVGKGTITIAGANVQGTVQSWLMYPDKLLVVTELPGLGTFRQGFDGTLGWTEDPTAGLHVVSGAELADLSRTASFDRAIRMKDVYPGLAVKERMTLNGRETWALWTFIEPWTYRFYFDAETGLISRFEMEQPGEGDRKLTIVLVPEDYRPVAGVMVPFTLSEISDSVSWVEKFTEITPNAIIDENIFARPPQTPAPK